MLRKPIRGTSEMFFMVIACLTMGVLSSIAHLQPLLSHYTLYLEITMMVWVTIEFMIRVWSAGCRSRYQGVAGRLHFLKRPLCIIDTVLILASLTTLVVVGSTQDSYATSVISGLRFFQILRMVRMDRRGGTWKLLGSVVWAHRQELVTTLYIGTLGLIFTSYLVYLAEKHQPRPSRDDRDKLGAPPKFSNFADALWWGVVTLCTVGYGDVVPTTWAGKVVASFSAVLGISFFALPAGILGSGFALKVQQQQRQKHLNRRRVPAAELIQCLWRCYAADEHSVSVATWKPHLVPCPSPSADRTWKNNTSFVSRFSTKRRDRERERDRDRSSHNSFSSVGGHSKGDPAPPPPSGPAPPHSPLCARHNSRRSAIFNAENEVTPTPVSASDRSNVPQGTSSSEYRQLELLPVKKENSVSSICKDSEEEQELSPRATQLTDADKSIIRALRKIRYFVARRKFREALRPYDVKDVIEQYSAGHVDMLGRIKNLQGRLDQILGRQGSKSKDVYESNICLASRIVKTERQVEDVESKLDLLIDLYKEDRKLLLQHLQQQDPTTGPSTLAPPPVTLKPRPILVDKQFTSEPATPTGPGMNPSRPMHRNLSDLSQRIKKRVTYRCLSLKEPPKRSPNKTNDPVTTWVAPVSSVSTPVVCGDLLVVSQPRSSLSDADPNVLIPPSPLTPPPPSFIVPTSGEARTSEDHLTPSLFLTDHTVGTGFKRAPDRTAENCSVFSYDSAVISGMIPTSEGSAVTSSYVSSSGSMALGTLAEQRSVDSECLAMSVDNSILPVENTSSPNLSKDSDTCHDSPARPSTTTTTTPPPPSGTSQSEVSTKGSHPGGGGEGTAAVTSLDVMTDFSAECEDGDSPLRTTC